MFVILSFLLVVFLNVYSCIHFYFSFSYYMYIYIYISIYTIYTVYISLYIYISLYLSLSLSCLSLSLSLSISLCDLALSFPVLSNSSLVKYNNPVITYKKHCNVQISDNLKIYI